MHIHYDPIARDLQEQVCQILNSDSQVSAMAYFFAEQSLDIDYNVRKSLASQGLAAIVMTPTLTLLGHDGATTSWQCDDLTLQIVENPIVNRARLKNLGLSSGTALDVAEVAAECLAGPQGGHFGEYSAKQVQTAEQNNLLVVKATFKTTCSRQLSGIISTDISGNTVEIPFATRDELNSLSSDVMQISTSFESFSTEEIKADISSLSIGQEALSSRFDSLSAVFQPKGDYAAASSLTAYALKEEVPTKTSQLANDSGYVTSEQVKPSGIRLGFAESAEKALTATFAEQAGTANKVAWTNVTGKPDLDALSANALAEANKHSDDNLATAEWYASNIADGVRVWTGENFIYRASIDLPTEPKYQGYVSKAVSADSVASIEWDKVQNKPEIPAKTSQLVNDSGYVTSAEVEPSEDYEGYAFNAENAVNALYASTAGYAENAGAAPWNGITGKPDLALKSDIPTKTSQLDNDSGYLNEASLSDYVTKDELPSLTGYATDEYVDQKVGQEASARQAADRFISSIVDNKAWLSSIPTKNSQLANDSGYLSAHQSLSNYYTKEETDEKIAQKQDAYELFSRNDQQKIEGDRLVYRLSADEWVNIGELALKSDISASTDAATEEYVDDKVMQEALARQEADQQLRASIGEKANISQIPTKTSQLTNDSGYLTAHQSLSDYYTKQQTDEAISSALSSAEVAKCIQSEDGQQRIYGNGDVRTLSSAPGTYGPWTDEDGNVDETWRVTEITANVFSWISDNGNGVSQETWSSREEAQSAKSFRTYAGAVWTRTYTPGAETWTKDGELALKSDIPNGLATQEYVDQKLTSYVSKTDIVPSQTNQGSAESAVSAVIASYDGNGDRIDLFYAKKTELNTKQDKLPYNAQWDVYDIGCWSAVNATRDVNGKDIDTTYATKQELASYVTKTDVVPSQTNIGAAESAVSAVIASYDGNGNLIEDFYAKKSELEQLSAVVGTANTQLEEIA